MEPWFKAYVEKFSYTTATSGEWKDFLYSYFSGKKEILDQVDWDMWFHQAGMPEQSPVFDNKLEQECIDIAEKWAESTDYKGHSKNEYDHLNTLQKIILFGHLEKNENLDDACWEAITKTYEMENVNNSEIRFQWIMFGLRTKNQKAFIAGEAMVRSQGRMKFTRPLFKSMEKVDREKTIAIYEDIRPFMHPTTADMVAKDLKV